MVQYAVWRYADRGVVNSIYEEIGGSVCKDKDRFIELYDYATHEPHSFMFIDLNPKRPELALRKGFDELILVDDEEVESEVK